MRVCISTVSLCLGVCVSVCERQGEAEGESGLIADIPTDRGGEIGDGWRWGFWIRREQ